MSNELAVIEVQGDRFTVVINRGIFEHVLPYRPSWITPNEFLELFIWISCLDDVSQPEHVTVQKTVDQLFAALKLCCQRQRILNDAGLVEGALGVMVQGFRTVTIRGGGLWSTLKLMISDGYRFKVASLETDGVYLWMFEN